MAPFETICVAQNEVCQTGTLPLGIRMGWPDSGKKIHRRRSTLETVVELTPDNSIFSECSEDLSDSDGIEDDISTTNSDVGCSSDGDDETIGLITHITFEDLDFDVDEDDHDADQRLLIFDDVEEHEDKSESFPCFGGWLLKLLNLSSRTRRTPLLTQVSDISSTRSTSSRSSILNVIQAVKDEKSATKRRESLLVEAFSFDAQGMFQEAIETYNQVLSLCYEFNEDYMLGKLHRRIAELECQVGEYSKSMHHLAKAFDVSQATGSNEDVAEIYVAAGRLHLAQGDFRRCMKSLKSAAKLLEDPRNDLPKLVRPSERSLHVFAKTIHAIGNAYEVQGNIKEARKNYNIALSLLRDTSGSRCSIDTAATLMSLGSLHEKLKEYNSALHCFKEANDIYNIIAAKYGRQSVYSGKSLSKIGWVYFLLGDLENALSVLTSAYGIFMQLDSKANIANIMTKMGEIDMYQGMTNDAVSTFNAALSLQREVFGDCDHEDIATTLLAIGLALEKGKYYERSIHHVDRALKIRRKLFGENNLLTGDALVQLGRVYHKMGFSDSSIRCFNSALDIFKVNQLKRNDPRVLHVKSILWENGKSKK